MPALAKSISSSLVVVGRKVVAEMKTGLRSMPSEERHHVRASLIVRQRRPPLVQLGGCALREVGLGTRRRRVLRSRGRIFICSCRINMLHVVMKEHGLLSIS